MLRTSAVKLSDGSVAFRFKARKGDTKVAVITTSGVRHAITVDKRGDYNDCTPTNDAWDDKFIKEIINCTSGLPYGYYKSTHTPQVADADINYYDRNFDEDVTDKVVIDSKEYQSFINNYTDKNGKLSYQLLNRDFITLADKSSVVSELIAAGAQTDAIITYLLRCRLSTPTNSKLLTKEYSEAFLQLLNSASDRSAFKELKKHIHTRMAEAKRG